MNKRFKLIYNNKVTRLFLVGFGWLLITGAFITGPLPGPGPMIVAPIGLAIILKNSLWAKKRYSRFVRNHPAYGHWIDWAMRRRKATQRPATPDIKGDILYLFRRDDEDQELP